MTDLIEKARKFVAMAEKATPGPWKVMGDKEPFIGVESDPALGKHGKVVIDGDSDGRRVWLNGKRADLRLCAAAPEMAKLLGEMADRLERLSTLLETKERIQFYCPECGGTLAILESGALMAPWEGTIRCKSCRRLWKVQLVEAKDNE